MSRIGSATLSRASLSARLRKPRSTQAPWATSTRPVSDSRIRSIASASGGASASSSGRSPWIGIVSAPGIRSGRISVERIPPIPTRPSSTGTAAKAMISSRRGLSPVVSRSTTAYDALRHGVSGGGSAVSS